MTYVIACNDTEKRDNGQAIEQSRVAAMSCRFGVWIFVCLL